MSHPASKLRLLAHGVLELPPDINGELDGASYRPHLGIKDLRATVNRRVEVQSVWGGRKLSLASGQEEYAYWVLEGDWCSLSIREAYWYSDRGAEQVVLEGERPTEVTVSTLDFVLTRPPVAPSRRLRYRALSSKPVAMLETRAVVRRHKREDDYSHGLAWEWAHLVPPAELAIDNHRTLRRMVLPVRWPIDYANDDARALAHLLYCTTSEKPLHRLLAMLGKRLGIPVDDQEFVFGAAYYLGYLGLDHTKVLDSYKPLALAPAPRWSKGDLVR